MLPDMDTLIQKLKKELPHIMLANKIPGMSLALIQNHQIYTTMELGIKNVFTREPVNASTVFEGASFTKPLIGYAALKLCEKKKLDIDTPLRKYLDHPYLSDPKYLKYITLRHVLLHTSGFPEVHLLVNEPVVLEFKPGTKYLYAQWGFVYLVHVMENILSGDLHDFLQTEVLEPLGMHDSSFIWLDKFEKQAASPHNWAGFPVEKWHPAFILGSASLHTTPTDFAKFLLFTINHANSTSKNDLLNMLDTRTHADKGIEWGLGWGIELTPEDEMIFHAGNTITFRSFAMTLRKAGFGAVLMTNSANSYKVFPQIIELIFNDKHKSICDFEEFATEDEKWRHVSEEIRCTWWKSFGF